MFAEYCMALREFVIAVATTPLHFAAERAI
jgi:hypothetical protein